MSSNELAGGAGAPQAFRCEIAVARRVAHVRAIGELDLATSPILRVELAALQNGGARSVILDLTDVGFMDSSGLHCILDCDAESRQDGFTLELIQGPPAVQRVFALTNTESLLRFIQA